MITSAWMHDGWFEEVIAWIEHELARLGSTRIAPVEAVKKWSISCILRVPTMQGNVYFKASAALPLFANEPAVTRGLSAWFPGHVPEVLAADDERGWMLMADVGQRLDRQSPAEVYEEVICLFGSMQLQSVGRTAELVSMGCVDRRLERLATQIGPLLWDGTAQAALDGGDIEQLRQHASRLVDLCGTLGALPVPPTLVHGDLHLGNITRQDGRYIFFDWTDACVAFPFFDLWENYFVGDVASQTRIRDAYLALWHTWGTMDQLQAAWTLAKPLCALHHAVTYQHILASLPASSDLEL